MSMSYGEFGTDVPNYTDENVSARVVKVIQSYTGIVNKMRRQEEPCMMRLTGN